MNYPELISTSKQVIDMTEALKESSIIAFDTEFIRESTFFPIVEIIQVANETDSWLVDAQAFKKNSKDRSTPTYDPGIQPLLDLLKDPNVLKIVHAAPGDQECLYTAFGTVASPSLDTAVAASLCGYGDGIGLGKLVSQVLGITLQKGHARTNWSVRPLPKQLMEYAHSDVVHLVALGKRLLEMLEKLGRKSWALELSAKSENEALYQMDVEGMTRKLARGGRLDKKALQALRGLVSWREHRVRQLNIPRRWVADDHVLIDLAQVRPKDLEHLQTFRGLNKGELKVSGEAILKAICESQGQEPMAGVKPEKPPTATPQESQVLELLGVFLSFLADRHQVAAKHLLLSSQFLPLLRSRTQDPSQWVSAGILTEEASQMIGQDLVDFLQGKRALAVKNNQVQFISLEDQSL
ncbi:MAG: ribonuclease D [Bdellovibrionia bacterium]